MKMNTLLKLYRTRRAALLQQAKMLRAAAYAAPEGFQQYTIFKSMREVQGQMVSLRYTTKHLFN